MRNSKTNLSDSIWASAPIIVSNNDLKDALNIEAAKNFAMQTKQHLHYYYATNKRMGEIIIEPILQNKLLSYHSGKTDQRLGKLPLCKGMPIILTQNYIVSNRIVNGCIGMVQQINYTIDEIGHRHAHSCIIQNENIRSSSLPHLQDHKIVALEDDILMTFNHPHSNTRCSFNRTQLPIMPAFSLTSHKSQGITLPSAIINLESCISMEAAYVMLSRVKNSNHIRILRPFHKTKICTRPSEDLRNEFKRLKFLDAETWHSSRFGLRSCINPSGGVPELERLENWFSTQQSKFTNNHPMPS